jgi:hypothetical protein
MFLHDLTAENLAPFRTSEQEVSISFENFSENFACECSISAGGFVSSVCWPEMFH